MGKISISIESLSSFKNCVNSVNDFSPTISLAANSISDILCTMNQALGEIEQSFSDVDTSLGRVDSTLQKLTYIIAEEQAEKAKLESELIALIAELALSSPKSRDAILTRIEEVRSLIKEKTTKIAKHIKNKILISGARKKLDHISHKLSTARNSVRNLIKDIEKTEPQINDIQVKISKASELALAGLNSIENIVNDYCLLEIRQTPLSEKYVEKFTETSYPTTEFYCLTKEVTSPPIDYAENITESEANELRINQAALEGSFLFLESTGFSFDSFDTATDEEKIKKIMDQGASFDEAKRLISIYNANFLPNEDGSHEAFLGTSPQSTGDSYEWQRFFYNLRNGKKTAKEVPFDLTKYKGEKCVFLGYDEVITNGLRKTDVVRYEGTREIHEELKVGRANSKKSLAEFRQELYGDDLRLRLYPNHEQEYRIRKSATNGNCMFDDRERALYLYFMACRHPDRVRVYFNDKLLSMDELRKLGE